MLDTKNVFEYFGFFLGNIYPILYFSMCVCVSAFFSATAEPFALKFAKVFQNSAGKISSKLFANLCVFYWSDPSKLKV